MKQKISQHISQAILNAHVNTITYVPGFGANQVADELNRIKPDSVTLSYHEEVAFSISLGTAIAGKRSIALLKTHGIAKAANAVVDSLSCGVNAGFVVLVFDDKDGAHSDNIFDAESMIKGLRIPYRKIKGKNAYESVHEAFLESERLQLPFLLLFDAEYVLEEYSYEPKELHDFDGSYERDLKQYLVVPPLAKYQYDVLNAKLKQKNPQSIPEPQLPRTDQIPDQWQPTIRLYKKFYDVFKNYRVDIVCGDTGIPTLFAFEPYNCVDICTHMGGSIPLAIGAMFAGNENVWAVTGDFSFIAAGHLGLIEALNRSLAIKVVIFNNKKAETTGGQLIHNGLLMRILKPYEENLIIVDDPQNREKVKEALEKASLTNDLQIIVLNY